LLSDSEQKQLVEANLDYARKLARGLKTQISSDFSHDELVAYGNRGLVEAAARFDPTRGASFKTFSYYRIRGAILDGVRAEGWHVRNRNARFVQGSNDLLENMADRQPASGPHTTSPTLEDATSDLAESLNQLTTIFLLADEEELGRVADDTKKDAEEQVDAKKQAGKVEHAVNSLPERERKMIELCYYQDKSIREAGDSMGLSRSWSSRLHARAIKLLGQTLQNAL
jgi:RNA polymerase sigma factor FliA